MAKRFTRNITDTVLTGKNKEPLDTNIQNDLLSDDTDVYVRNGQEYVCITDGISNITSKDKTIKVTKKDKTVDLSVIGGGGGTGEEFQRVTEIKPASEMIDVDVDGSSTELKTIYNIGVEKVELFIKELEAKIKNLEKHIGAELGFLGNVVGYDFNYYRDNHKIIHTDVGNYDIDITLGKAYADKDVGLNVITIPSTTTTAEYGLNIKSTDDMYTEPFLAINYTFEVRNNCNTNMDLKFNGKFDFLKVPIYENKLEYQNGDIQLMARSITKFQITCYRNEAGKPMFTFIQLIEQHINPNIKDEEEEEV